MSFVSPQQRGYDSLPNSDLNQPHTPSQSPAKVSMTPLSSFVPVNPLPSASSAPTSPVDSTANNSDRAQAPLPKVGETRCYWALLTPDLTFLYLDPVLQSHLQEQADSLVGKSLITLVHPDEQASAKEDLGGVLDSRTLHGSVTRVRFSRLSRVRRQLGYQGTGPDWSDADKISVDANYMAVDLVINWAADGLVLCFMHAVVDLNPRDNDEHNKTGWTNWCGTPHLSMEQVQLLYQRLYTSVPQPPSMSRVFQILLNQAERQLWVTWPPDPTQNTTVPNSKDFAKLAEDIEINNATSSSTDAKTSCTRRYRATQLMDFGIDGEKEVESIFIPYGSIIFACHKVSSAPRTGINISHVGPPPSHHPGGYPPVHQHYYDPPPHSYSLPPVPHPSAYNGYPPPPPPPYGPWSHPHEPPHGSYAPWSSQHHPVSGLSVSSVRSSSYPAPQQHQWSSQPPSYMDQGPPGPYAGHPAGIPYGTPGPDDSPPSGNVVPPRGGSRRGSGSTREQYGNGGRSAGNPPVGVTRCSSCKATQSPEWRKGPSGKKDLCNACGLRYARSRAKKEGGAASRRRKDRTVGMASKASPSASPVGMSFNNGLRGVRTYDESFSTGSASGSDMYPPGPAHSYHEHTSPSPSPPSNSMNYVPYAHHSHQNNSPIDNRSSHFAPAHTFYSVPPPPPNPAMHHMPHHGHPNSLPRLEPPLVSQYGRPASPSIPSPASPTSASPLSVSLSAASFERERQNDKGHGREVAPSTSPAESRHSRFTP